MTEWVTKAHALLLASGLSEGMLRLAVSKSADAGSIRMRKGTANFFSSLSKQDVPIVVFSAGIADVLEEVLKHSFNATSLPENIVVISNRCVFDATQEGKLVDFEEPLLHVFNKNFASHFSSGHPVYERLLNRENLVLIGDSLGDVTMSCGLPHNQDTLIKIGFLYDRPERLPEFLEAFDVVILGDPSFDFVNNLVSLV